MVMVEAEPNSNSMMQMPRIVEGAKLFIITVIIAAVMQKLGEGLYGFLHIHTEAGGKSKFAIFSRDLVNFQSWQLLLVIYFMITLVRHAGAIFAATPLFTTSSAGSTSKLAHKSLLVRYSIGAVDTAVTMLLFIGHFVVALSLASHWSSGKTLANIESPLFIAFVLMIDLLLCVFWICALVVVKNETLEMKEIEVRGIRELNVRWAVFSFIELILVLLSVALMGASQLFLVSWLYIALITIAIMDFISNGKHWMSIIETRFH